MVIKVPIEFKHFSIDKSNKDLGENVHGNETMKVASTHISNLASQKVKT